MAEASAPVYLETSKGRIGLIAACATFEPPSMAGEQSRNFIGRPGLNGLRHDETYVVTKEQMNILRQISEETHINGREDIMRSEGYLPPMQKGTLNLKSLSFKQGDRPQRITTVNREDMSRVEKAICEAEFQSDYVAVAIHSHELAGNKKETPDDFLVEFAHKCIDAGADAIIGTGPHILRPIEIYKGCPIFYSLGDFILHNENIPYGPEEFYAAYGLNSDDTMRALYTKRSKNFTRGLQTDKRAFESVIPCCEYEGGKLSKITMLPVELGFGRPRSTGGTPRPMRHAPFIDRLAQMSAPYGTVIRETEDGLAEIVL